MPEILTESFCERCGTRYTFEAVAPKARPFTKLKILSKGLRNYVLSDETSLDEALADARSDEQRQVSGQQLEAFHKTFNFCLNCRQYTCSNCWNEAEGRCLTCAPNLSQDILPRAFPNLPAHPSFEPIAQDGDAAWAADYAHSNGESALPGLAPSAPPNGRTPTIEASAWPTVDLRTPPAQPTAEGTASPEAAAVEPAAPESETYADASGTWIEREGAEAAAAEPDLLETSEVPEMAEAEIAERLRQLTWAGDEEKPAEVAGSGETAEPISAVEPAPAVPSGPTVDVEEPALVSAEPLATVTEDAAAPVEASARASEPVAAEVEEPVAAEAVEPIAGEQPVAADIDELAATEQPVAAEAEELAALGSAETAGELGEHAETLITPVETGVEGTAEAEAAPQIEASAEPAVAAAIDAEAAAQPEQPVPASTAGDEGATHHPALDERAAAAVARTVSLLGRFRPTRAHAEPVPEQAPVAEAEGVSPIESLAEHAAPVEPAAEPAAAVESPVAAEPESAGESTPVAAAMPPAGPSLEQAPTPAAAPAPELAPVPAAPAWQVVAPETPPPAQPALRPAATGQPGPIDGAPEYPAWPGTPAGQPVAPREPAPWAPSRDPRRTPAPGVWEMPAPPAGSPPQWPPAQPAAPAWPGAGAAPSRSADAVWVESSRSVLDRPGSGVQACVSCGLPLSATARFCRRCGSRQG